MLLPISFIISSIISLDISIAIGSSILILSYFIKDSKLFYNTLDFLEDLLILKESASSSSSSSFSSSSFIEKWDNALESLI
jgi:hypothetical protein